MAEHRHEFSWKTEVDKDTAFDALTSSVALEQWFAEFVDVELTSGGRFRFWGRHTIDTPAESDATQSIVGVTKPDTLSFNWRLFSQDSVVTLQLNGDEDGKTTVVGTHIFDELPQGVRVKDMIDDLWKLHGGNFVQYLNGGDGLCLPNYDDPNPAITQTILIDAPRAKVFKALVTPELMAKWLFAENAVVEERVGGVYSYGWQYEIGGKSVTGGPTKILEYVENEKLVTDWPDWRGDESVPDQTVTWLLEDAGSKTKVTVIHSGFVRAVDFSDFPFGWGHFLSMLADTVTTGN